MKVVAVRFGLASFGDAASCFRDRGMCDSDETTLVLGMVLRVRRPSGLVDRNANRVADQRAM